MGDTPRCPGVLFTTKCGEKAGGEEGKKAPKLTTLCSYFFLYTYSFFPSFSGELFPQLVIYVCL